MLGGRVRVVFLGDLGFVLYRFFKDVRYCIWVLVVFLGFTEFRFLILFLVVNFFRLAFSVLRILVRVRVWLSFL